MPAYTILPCGAAIKTSGISRLIPLDKEQPDPNRIATKPTLLIHHGSQKLRVEFKTIAERNDWLSTTVSHLNAPSKP